PAWPQLERHLSVARRHGGAARLRRAAEPALRALAADPRAARPLRRALPDRRADAAGTGRQGAEGGRVPPGLQDRGVPVERPPRPEGAPEGRRAHRTGRLRAPGAGGDRHAAADRAAPPPAAFFAHVLLGEL